jgi:hypothetical protein
MCAAVSGIRADLQYRSGAPVYSNRRLREDAAAAELPPAQSSGCSPFANFRIELCMRCTRHLAAWFLAVTFFCGSAQAATPGSFRGTVVEGENGAPQVGWLYVRGKNGSIRRVDISHATVTYDEDVPADSRKSSAREQLVVGAEVRITAEQDRDGEWRASRIEIIQPAPGRSAEQTRTGWVNPTPARRRFV